jgi:O-antigen/teichoic acid export membrane protein
VASEIETRDGRVEARSNGKSLLKSRLLSGGIWALGGRIVTPLAILASNALLGRLLSPGALGNFFLASSLVSVGAITGSLGLTQAVVRFVAESVGLGQFERTRSVIGRVLALGSLGAAGMGIVYVLFGGVLGEKVFDSPALAGVTGLVAGWMAVMTLQTLLAEVFRGFHDVRLATIFGGVVTWLVITAGLGLLWLLEDQVRLSGVILLAAGSSLVSVMVACWLLAHKVTALPARGGTAPNPRFGEILRVAAPILVVNLTLFLLAQASLWVVGAFRPQEDVAIYGAAIRLAVVVEAPLVIVNAVVPPLIAELYAQGRRRELESSLRVVATLSGIPASVVVLGCIFLGGPILGLVFGDYYRAGASVLALLSTAVLVSVCVGACHMTLMMTGHQTGLMVITSSWGIVTMVSSLAVVGPYGIEGVAAIVAAGLALRDVSVLLWAKRVTEMWTHVGFTDLFKLARATEWSRRERREKV